MPSIAMMQNNMALWLSKIVPIKNMEGPSDKIFFLIDMENHCGCLAHLRITRKWSFEIFPEEWHVTKFIKEYKHDMLSSEKMRFLPVNRTIIPEDEKQILLYKEAGLSIRQIIQIMELEKNVKHGDLSFSIEISAIYSVNVMKEAPKTIITDQDPWMSEAISTKMPTTKHSFCIWHITSKFSSWFAALLRNENQKWCGGFYMLYKMTSPEEFEHNWSIMIERYTLQGNKHVKGLYKVREFGHHLIFVTTFLEGMITTGRSERINAFTKRFISSHTCLTEFVDMAVEEFSQERSRNKVVATLRPISLKTISPLEKQAFQVLTPFAFKKFQEELARCTIMQVDANEIRLFHDPSFIFSSAMAL
ncbi:Protein FAR1-RELATED SEQUENCE 11 [Bienertia sinuspersici]